MAYQPAVRGSCNGKPLGCSTMLRWLNRGMVWVKLRWLEPTRHKRGLLGGCDAHAGGETSVGTLQARGKPLNSLVVMSWHTPWKCVRVLVGTTSIRLSMDNHDSWVTCTSSAECKTIITVVIPVMSGMDPHMIRWNLRWVWIGLVWLVGLWKWISLGCGSVTV
jgi:hypothetical protein